jgi:hypothetical protein
MYTDVRRAVVSDEIRRLILFDHKAFYEYPGDWFHQTTWQTYESWWLIVGKRQIGCSAFKLHVDFKEDIHRDKENPHRRGSLYVATTGVLPQFRGKVFGTY